MKSAVISPCGKYRYWLTRYLGGLTSKGHICFVMLNPSTADADLDDPTIRRCMGFARREGFDQLSVVNLYAFRATNPDDLIGLTDDEAQGPDNWRWVYQAIEMADVVVAAWGASIGRKGMPAPTDWATPERLIHCLGTTKDGHPRHPLYVKGDQPLEWFEGKDVAA